MRSPKSEPGIAGEDVVRRVEFIVVTGPGAVYQFRRARFVHELRAAPPVSSSDIRRLPRNRDDDVPVPAPVLRYIREHGLLSVTARRK